MSAERFRFVGIHRKSQQDLSSDACFCVQRRDARIRCSIMFVLVWCKLENIVLRSCTYTSICEFQVWCVWATHGMWVQWGNTSITHSCVRLEYTCESDTFIRKRATIMKYIWYIRRVCLNTGCNTNNKKTQRKHMLSGLAIDKFYGKVFCKLVDNFIMAVISSISIWSILRSSVWWMFSSSSFHSKYMACVCFFQLTSYHLICSCSSCLGKHAI